MEDRCDVQFVIGPDGERMTRADLPPTTTRRWVPRRKAKVVAAVEGGLITQEEAARLYSISDEEFDCWRSALSSYGMRGLRVTQLRRSRTRSE
ncbi:DUF1153 domain-containing protein [Paralimibaculum aggregatum]|uniref:DUF1153 domain-containing protein n=1 Tax=Paralimibaculum aggregatum TaxID=3036245 RepID=A0ABQ6LMM8_9RHOB|nr:DUF1153 domain-containing protein [Limibaculum sp. NKW23]GMG84469.1 DUF1153 domain-containing protein [Limibaculum sp. NKW23]